MPWYARFSPSLPPRQLIRSSLRAARSKVLDLLMHLVYTASGLPTLYAAMERRRRQRRFHWIIRSPWHRRRRRRLAVAAARRINGTLEYKLVERFEIVRFSSRLRAFFAAGTYRRYLPRYFGGKVPRKR